MPGALLVLLATGGPAVASPSAWTALLPSPRAGWRPTPAARISVGASAASPTPRQALLEAVRQQQSRSARRAVEAAADAVVQSRATRSPSLLPQAPQSAAKRSIWRLVWSSQTADVNPFALPAEVLGGECFQVVEPARIANVVLWRTPIGNVELIGSARARASSQGSSVRRDVTITGLQVRVNGQPFELFKVRGLVDGQQPDQGYLDDLYNDGDLRISRANNGFQYIYTRERGL